ncbi:MAG TPA: hypothetical protein VFR81_05805 [Longimicrobium sp.]|nr:hypothetical protein [Longimicrobium sp.]
MADRDEPPFEGGSQPVKQRPPSVLSSRPSPMPVIMGIVVFILIAAGFVFLFSH